MSQNQEHKISVDQLQVGVYVHLDVGWMQHPFGFNNFKIRDEEQLLTIRKLGLASVRWDPARSDLKPLPKVRDVPPQPEEAAHTRDEVAQGAEPLAKPAIEPVAEHGTEEVAMMVEKQARIQALAEHRINMAKVEKAFAGAASMVRGMGKSIHVQPEKTVAEATQLIGEMVDSLLLAPDLAIQVMAEKPGSEDVYFHSLNVSVLAMIVAREIGLPAEIVRQIGIGALFHDIGLNEVPAKILLNPGTLTKAEREFREVHCQYGLDIGRKAGLPQGVLNIVHQHHEYFDGSGYPRKLKGDAIDPLARLVGLVNAFDNLCNPPNLALALTPHEALSRMFSKQRNLYDPKLLQVFIRFMGVYPPGTVVGLSNDAFGLVVKVNAARALKPTVLVHDAAIPKSEALILDLAKESGVNITRAIRPIQLPPEVFDYLSPRRRVSYYFDEGRPGGCVS